MGKIILISAIAFVLIAATGIIIQTLETQKTEYKFPGAAEAVRQYFDSWDKKDWPNMYAVISDGFKKIEPTAKTLSSFRGYAESQGIKEVNIVDITEKSNDGKTAVVDYSVEFTLSGGTKKEFKDSFTLKFREADVIKGWKLIHPYEEKIDTS